MRIPLVQAIAVALMVWLSAAPASAHHSFVQFDMGKTITVSGTVRTLEWTNPHVWLWIDVPDGKGGHTSWGFEGRAIGEMTRSGWKRNSIKPGDKVTIETNPLRGGRPGGTLGKITFADGRVLGEGSGGGPPPGGPPPEGFPPGGPPPGAPPSSSASAPK